MLNERSDGIKVEDYRGKWYVIDSCYMMGKKLFLVEHETYGDETACLILDSNGKLLLDEVYNGFDDYFEHLESEIDYDYNDFDITYIKDAIKEDYHSSDLEHLQMYLCEVWHDNNGNLTQDDINNFVIDGLCDGWCNGWYVDDFSFTDLQSIKLDDFSKAVKENNKTIVAQTIVISHNNNADNHDWRMNVPLTSYPVSKTAMEKFEKDTGDSFAILQLPEAEYTKAFLRGRKQVDFPISEYIMVETNSLQNVSSVNQGLNSIYDNYKWNGTTIGDLCNAAPDYYGSRPLSIGDVIAIKLNSEISYHNVKEYGFSLFGGDEQQLEQNKSTSLIDGAMDSLTGLFDENGNIIPYSGECDGLDSLEM